MYAVLICLAITGQTHVRIGVQTVPVVACSPCYGPERSCNPNLWYNRPWEPIQFNWPSCYPGWYYWKNDWQASVDNVRAARANAPRPIPTESEWAAIQDMESVVRAARDAVKAAPPADKAVLRSKYYELRDSLSDARLDLSREVHRRRRLGIRD